MILGFFVFDLFIWLCSETMLLDKFLYTGGKLLQKLVTGADRKMVI